MRKDEQKLNEDEGMCEEGIEEQIWLPGNYSSFFTSSPWLTA